MKKTTILSIVIMAALAISLGFTAIMYLQEIQENAELKQAASNSDFYWDMLERIEAYNSNSSLSPPVNMEDAIEIAFQGSSWTAESLMKLNVTTVDVKIVYGCIYANSTVIESVVTSPQLDYSPVTLNGATYRYMWQIVAYNEDTDMMALTHDGYCLVDVVTGEILPTAIS